MRRSASLLGGIVVVVLAAATAAQAGIFVTGESMSATSIGGTQSQPLSALSGTEAKVSLVDNGSGGHDLHVGSTVWSTLNRSDGTSMYTGVPFIDDIRATYRNRDGTFTSSYTLTNFVGDGEVVGPFMGGQASVDGQLVLWVLGIPAIAFDLTVVGGPPGAVSTQNLLGIPITMTAGPWVTGPVPMTGITTNVISYNGVTGPAIELRLTGYQHPKVLSTGGGFVSTGAGLPLEAHTVTLPADNELLSASQTGSVTLVCPIRINTTPSISGRVPGASWRDIKFVPEPGTLLLLVTGAVGLVAVGRRRAVRAGEHRPRK
jgi:hypothetical protein